MQADKTRNLDRFIYYFAFTYVVFVRVVECINNRRLCGPFVLVDGFPQFSHISVGLKAQDGKEVDEELFGSNG